MFGRKARQIANQAIMIATFRKESVLFVSQIMEKNKQIIALNDTIQEHTQQLEDLRAKVSRAEGSADAAIQAGGIISGQLHAAQADLAARDATIAGLTVQLDDLKRAGAKLSAALRQARVQLDAYAADDERKPGKPGTAAGRRPRLDFGQDVEALISAEGEPSKATPPSSQQ